MIKGPKFRGISYKCGTGYFVEKKWTKAIIELESLPSYIDDPPVCEMLGTCYLQIGNHEKSKYYFKYAADGYTLEGSFEKASRLLSKLEKVSNE